MKLQITPENSRSWLDHAVGISDESRKLFGKPLVVEIKESKPRHTNEQQRYYWATLHEWGKELGYTTKETEVILHNLVLCEAYGIEKYIEYGGSRWPVPKSRSSDRNVTEYSELIETLVRLVGND